MKPPGLTEDERIKATVRLLVELLQQFGNPLKRPAKVIPIPNHEAMTVQLPPKSIRNKAATPFPESTNTR
jgi:hypothetical protein